MCRVSVKDARYFNNQGEESHNATQSQRQEGPQKMLESQYHLAFIMGLTREDVN